MSPRGFILKESDLLPLSLGAALLGTGGGGNPYVGMLQSPRTAAQGRLGGGAAAGGDRRRRLDRLGRRHRRAGRRRREDQARPGMFSRLARRRGGDRRPLLRADLGRDGRLQFDRADPDRRLCRPARRRRRRHGTRVSRNADVDLLHLRAGPVARRDRRRQGQCRRVQEGRRHVLARALRPARRGRHGRRRRASPPRR